MSRAQRSVSTPRPLRIDTLSNAVLSLLLATGLVAVGCGGNAEEEAGFSAEGKEEACQTFCETAEDCGQPGDVTECTDSCADSELTSKAGQEVLTDCYAASECNTDNPLVLIDCVEDGLEELPVSELGEQFCNDGLSQINECLGQETTEADAGLCMESVAVLSDEFLDELMECADPDCDGTELCVGLAFIDAIGAENLQDLSQLGALGEVFGDSFGGFEDVGDLGDFDGDTSMGGASSR